MWTMKLISPIFVILTMNSASVHSSYKNQPNSRYISQRSQNFETKHIEIMYTTSPQIQVDTLTCPLGCVCQYAPFSDLPISRWINYMQQRSNSNNQQMDSNRYDAANYYVDSQTSQDSDDNILTNPFIKQATCIVQMDTNIVTLMNELPHDLQSLILLYTDIGRNKTVNTSVLKPLNQLNTLEIHGPYDRSLHLMFDEPMSFLQYANFESITLLGSESSKRPKNPIHPSDSFDYRPKSELMFNSTEEDTLYRNTADKITNIKFSKDFDIDEFEILPYDVYIQEVKRARIPTFYDWKHLEVLRIHSCQMNELHWEMFDGLSTLQHLSLERNNIEVVPAFAFYGAAHIKTLSLAHNQISDLHYRALAGPLELEVLDVRNNRLRKLSELSFPPFPKLQSVYFQNNPIKYIFPATFWVMNGTTVMQFSSQEVALELWTNMPFESLQELLELSIENVSIVNLEQNIFKDLIALQKLQLRGKIHRIEFDAFAGLGQLEELSLSNCKIEEISMDAFIGCKNLEIIDLSYNNLSYIPPGLFDDQSLLQEIYLQGNQLRTLPPTFFQKQKLRLARLNDNPWQCNCDMSNWRSKITNQERGPGTKRCITYFQTGEKIACRRIESFKYNHNYAPRCHNYNERSVFYVLRKQLQCESGRVVLGNYKRKNRVPTWRKIQEQQQRQKSISNGKANWKTLSRENKRNNPKSVPNENSLDFVLTQKKAIVVDWNFDMEHQVKVEIANSVTHVENDNDISNEIYY